MHYKGKFKNLLTIRQLVKKYSYRYAGGRCARALRVSGTSCAFLASKNLMKSFCGVYRINSGGSLDIDKGFLSSSWHNGRTSLKTWCYLRMSQKSHGKKQPSRTLVPSNQIHFDFYRIELVFSNIFLNLQRSHFIFIHVEIFHDNSNEKVEDDI